MVNKLYEHLVTFIQKLKLIQLQLVLKKVVHCPVFSSRPTDTVQHEQYSDLVTKLADDFEKMFQDFRRHIGTMKLISNPFSIDPTDAADKYQILLQLLQQVYQALTGPLEVHRSVRKHLLLRTTVF